MVFFSVDPKLEVVPVALFEIIASVTTAPFLLLLIYIPYKVYINY